MNSELLKQFADICKQLQDAGAFGISGNRLHVDLELLKGLGDLQIHDRESSDWPYEVFTVIEGVKLFTLAKVEDIKDFPHFKEFIKADLMKKIAELEKEEEALA